MEKYTRNNIEILFENAPKTPRTSVNFFFKNGAEEKYCGINALLSRLLLQGTKKYSALELSKEFENECIDITIKAKQDYIKASVTFLNEDFYKAMDLFKEIILNSTFDDYEKEVHKIKGEIISDLDNPKTKLTDAFLRELYGKHPYSSGYTKTLEEIDLIKKEDIILAHKNLFNCKKLISIAGDFQDKEQLLSYFENNFDFMKNSDSEAMIEDMFSLKEDKDIWLTKNDASQAQILQGWLVETFNSEDYPKYVLLNNILGGSGLSSRLFVNMRDKQGLAYTVRSQYETLLHSGIFSLYIGTAPKNIQKSLEGFEIELTKIAQNVPDKKELQGARENISGRLKYFCQNNSQIASQEGYNCLMGLGLNYTNVFMEKINKVSGNDISEMAKKLLNSKKLTAIIAPDKYKLH